MLIDFGPPGLHRTLQSKPPKPQTSGNVYLVIRRRSRILPNIPTPIRNCVSLILQDSNKITSNDSTDNMFSPAYVVLIFAGTGNFNFIISWQWSSFSKLDSGNLRIMISPKNNIRRENKTMYLERSPGNVNDGESLGISDNRLKWFASLMFCRGFWAHLAGSEHFGIRSPWRGEETLLKGPATCVVTFAQEHRKLHTGFYVSDTFTFSKLA